MSAYSQTIRQTLSLAWPVSLRFLVANLMTFIIVVILSFMGHQVLAASNLITSAQIAATVIANSLLFGLANADSTPNPPPWVTINPATYAHSRHCQRPQD
jgi:Na+-driven multidrug efflux pump